MRAPLLPMYTAAVALLGGVACVDLPQGLNPPKVSVVKVSAGDLQIVQVGSEVPIAVSIQVIGVDSQPIRGIEVRFAVRAGRGSVSGASRFTDSTGIATVGSWTVGDTPGTDTMTAIVVGVKRLYVIATVAPPCPGGAALALGDSVIGTVVDAGCVVTGGGRAAAYTVQPITSTGTVVGAGSPVFRARAAIYSNGIPVATSIVAGDTAPASSMTAYLSAGTYTLLAQGTAPADRGAFKVTTSNAAIYSGCLTKAYIVRGASTLQTLASDGCPYTDASARPYFGHDYKIRLAAGSTLVATASAVTMTPYILILNESGSRILLSNDQVLTSRSASVSFIAPYSGFFTIAVLTYTPNTTGAYTLSVSPLAP